MPAAEPTQDPIRYYFSFRSPYAWLATERLEAEIGDLGVPIERIPIYPKPGEFPNDPSVLPDKVAHLIQDVRRLAREQGLEVRFPSSSDTDWASCHAAYLGAEQAGAGHRFMIAVFRKRFSEGRDIGDDEVIAEAARAVDLDPASILEAAHSEPLRAQVSDGWRLAAERDRVFGVPSFAYAGKLLLGPGPEMLRTQRGGAQVQMIEGSCLCGEVRYQAERAAGPMAHCHCRMCRKAHGSAFSTILPVEKRGFRFISGESQLTSYESSPGKRRWFCSTCGSQMISTRDENESQLLLRAGCIDSGTESPPVAHGWTDSKAAWHTIEDALPRFERGFPGAPPGIDDD